MQLETSVKPPAAPVKAKSAQALMSDLWKQRGVYQENDATQRRLSEIGDFVLQGYRISGEHHASFHRIVEQVSLIPKEFQGFVYEGVGMGLAEKGLRLRGSLSLLEDFATQFAMPFHNWIYVGIGLMASQANISLLPISASFSRERRWLALDGYAYHQGVFHWQTLIKQRAYPETINEKITAAEASVFDQGLGRSLWFVDAGKVEPLLKTVEQFSTSRQKDLWGGIGYACAYAGGASEETLRSLFTTAATHQPQLLAGATFALKARTASECPAKWTSLTYQLWQSLSQSSPASTQAHDTWAHDTWAHDTWTHDTWTHYRANITHPTANDS